MGTTYDALRSDSGGQFAYVVCIEGYSKLLTSWHDKSAVATAWAGTLWTTSTAVLTGLKIPSTFEQSIKPWDNDLHPMQIDLHVQPDESDTFATAMFATKPSIASEMTVAFNPNNSAIAVKVKDNSNFGSSGTFFIGKEAFSYGSKTGSTDLNVVANGSGYFSPFAAGTSSGNRFPWKHLAGHGSGDTIGARDSIVSHVVATNPIVSQTPRTWIGRKVGIWLHRVKGGVLDVKAQAEVLFAGTIRQISESGDGHTIVSCEDIRGVVRDTTVLQNQFVARMKAGYNMRAGQWFDMVAHYEVGGAGGANSFKRGNNKFTCVSGAPAGAYEIQAGYYTHAELASLMSDWVNGDSNLNQPDGTNAWRWRVGENSTQNAMRFEIEADIAGSTRGKFELLASDGDMLTFLGWDNIRSSFGVKGTGASGAWDTDPKLTSDRPPMRLMPTGNLVTSVLSNQLELEFDDTEGKWASVANWLPPSLRAIANGDTKYSMLQIGPLIVLGQVDSVTTPTKISQLWYEPGLTASPSDLIKYLGEQTDASDVVIKQLVYLSGSFLNIVTSLLASVAGNNVNHSTYDQFTFGGCAIPWELMGTEWTYSCHALEQGSTTDALMVVIEKPTSVWDLLKSEFILRQAWLVWKTGGIVMQSLGVPSTLTADHALTEHNKAGAPGDKQFTVTEHTNDFLRNHIKVESDRNPVTNKYLHESQIWDVVSIEDFGQSRPVTIKARNSYRGHKGSGEAVEALVGVLRDRHAPVFSRPLKRYRRTVNPMYAATMAPGDTATLTDSFARNPTSGARSITARPCTVLDVRYSLGIEDGEAFGEVTLLYSDEERIFPQSPAADHASVTTGAYTSGWDAAGLNLLLARNTYSRSGDATSDGGYFKDGDKVRVIEIDPSNPASPDTFTDVLDGDGVENSPAGYDHVTLTTGFGAGGNPAFSSSKLYRVIPDDYSTVQASQVDTAYLADDGDGLIQNTIEANEFGEPGSASVGQVADPDLTVLPCRNLYSTTWAEGEPLHAGLMGDMITMRNNLANYRTAISAPILPHTADSYGSDIWTLAEDRALYLGIAKYPGGRSRALSIAPLFRCNGAGTTTTVRVTSSANPPRGGTWASTYVHSVEWTGPKNQITFSTTSTSWAVATAQDLEIVFAGTEPGVTWITVELKATGAGYGLVKGLAECYLKELA